MGYINPNSNCATSLIISFSQDGSNVNSILAERIPSISLNLSSTSGGNVSATGQLVICNKTQTNEFRGNVKTFENLTGKISWNGQENQIAHQT